MQESLTTCTNIMREQSKIHEEELKTTRGMYVLTPCMITDTIFLYWAYGMHSICFDL